MIPHCLFSSPNLGEPLPSRDREGAEISGATLSPWSGGPQDTLTLEVVFLLWLGGASDGTGQAWVQPLAQLLCDPGVAGSTVLNLISHLYKGTVS